MAPELSFDFLKQIAYKVLLRPLKSIQIMDFDDFMKPLAYPLNPEISWKGMGFDIYDDYIHEYQILWVPRIRSQTQKQEQKQNNLSPSSKYRPLPLGFF